MGDVLFFTDSGVFEAGDRAFEAVAGEVVTARVLVSLVDSRRFLSVGTGGVDRRHDRSGHLAVLLASVNAAGENVCVVVHSYKIPVGVRGVVVGGS